VLLYLERWLRAPVQMADGSLIGRERGTPQGGVISPLLANLFLHYAFDRWMRRNHPGVPFERYADDAICHCRSEEQARALRASLERRFADCELTLHPEKTKIVYCKDEDRRGGYPHQTFDFLGYTFRPCYGTVVPVHFLATPVIHGAKRLLTASVEFSSGDPRDRAAKLMLNRYDEKALEESTMRADELAAGGDDNGDAMCRRIANAVVSARRQHATRARALTRRVRLASPYPNHPQRLAAGSTNSRAICSSPAIVSRSVRAPPGANKAISSTPASR
jgi:hypothetical protein